MNMTMSLSSDSKKEMLCALCAMLFALCLSASAFAEDMLIVKDSGGVNTKFVVTDAGFVGAGTAAPLYNYDLSGQGVMKSSMHFSLNGTDVGGWITSVLDNNFFVSSGAVFNSAAGGWIQKSPDGKSVWAGSGASGYRVFLQSGSAVGGVITEMPRFIIDYSGKVGIGTTAPTQLLDVNSNGIRIEQPKTPASSSEACNQGDMSWDANYVYVCVAQNTWKRATLTSW